MPLCVSIYCAATCATFYFLEVIHRKEKAVKLKASEERYKIMQCTKKPQTYRIENLGDDGAYDKLRSDVELKRNVVRAYE